MKTKIKILCAILVTLSLVGCKTSPSAHDERVYEDGFDAGYEEALYSDDYYDKVYDDLIIDNNDKIVNMVEDFMHDEEYGQELFYNLLEILIECDDERTIDIIKSNEEWIKGYEDRETP